MTPAEDQYLHGEENVIKPRLSFHINILRGGNRFPTPGRICGRKRGDSNNLHLNVCGNLKRIVRVTPEVQTFELYNLLFVGPVRKT
jgi:hypothetical protein